MELLYYYAKGHNNLPPRGFNLSNKWITTYNENTGELFIIENHDYIENFFGKNIVSVSAFVGANGTGKTSMLNVISRTIAVGNTSGAAGEFSFLAVYKVDNIFYYYTLGKIFISDKIEKFQKASEAHWRENLKEHLSIFFSQHIEPLYSENAFHKQRESIYMGRKDISTAYIYRQTVIKNKDRIENITREFRKEDYRKYIKFFKNVEFKFGITTPKFISIKLFDLGQTRFDSIYEGWSVDKFLNQLTYHNTNIHHVQSKIIEQTIWQLLSKFTSNVKKNETLEKFFDDLANLTLAMKNDGTDDLNSILEKLSSFFPTEHMSIIQASLYLSNFIKNLNLSDKNVNADGVWLQIDQHNLKALLSEIDKAGLFQNDLDFIEIGFSHHPHQFATYSSGEYSIWSLFARIYDLKSNLPKHVLILLDEAELNLHPSWQRKFINHLLLFLNENFGKKKFQIIMSSHSPLILSDIPKWGVTLLSENEKSSDKTNVFSETFGANIHELYSTNFVLGDNFIGEFASQKIKALIEEVYKNDNMTPRQTQEYTKRIKMVGEPLIKEKLMQKVAMSSGESEIDILIQEKTNEITELKRIKQITKIIRDDKDKNRKRE